MAVALLIFLRLDIIYLGLVPHQFGRMAVDFAKTEEMKKVLQTRQKVSVRGSEGEDLLRCCPSIWTITIMIENIWRLFICIHRIDDLCGYCIVLYRILHSSQLSDRKWVQPTMVIWYCSPVAWRYQLRHVASYLDCRLWLPYMHCAIATVELISRLLILIACALLWRSDSFMAK